MERSCDILLENQFFSGQNKRFRTFYFPKIHKKFPYEDNPLHILHIVNKLLTIWARKHLSRQGEPCFLNIEMPKKIHAYSSINKSTERQSRLPHYQSAILFSIAADIAAYIITWTRKPGQARDAQKVALYVFPLWRPKHGHWKSSAQYWSTTCLQEQNTFLESTEKCTSQIQCKNQVFFVLSASP